MSKTCLIGESDPFIARLLLRFSEKSGLDPIQARVGEEVLRLAQERPPCVIIVDPELPGRLRGWEAVHSLRQDSGLRHAAVITCSWLPAAQAAALVGVTKGHLQKPDLYYRDFLAMLEAIGLQPGALTIPSDVQ